MAKKKKKKNGNRRRKYGGASLVLGPRAVNSFVCGVLAISPSG